MATDREIKQVYDSMREICRETSQMLTVIHDHFVKRHFRMVNSAIVWGTSAQYREPDGWMPYFQQMVFVLQNMPDAKRGVGVNVMFDDPNLQNTIPYVSCGLLIWEPSVEPSKSDALYCAGWNAAKVIATPPLYNSHFTDAVKWDASEITNYFLSLATLSSEDKVVSLIVEPLVNLYGERTAATVEAIKHHAITLEFIKGESPVAS